MTLLRPATLAAVGAVTLFGVLTGCGEDGGATGAAVHQVKAGDDSCQLDDTSLQAGQHTFEIENVGSDVTEVYVYGEDGEDFTQIMGERENIGPGTSQTLRVDLTAGRYQLACKPGMTGDGIRTSITVAGEGGSSEAKQESYDRELALVVDENGTVNHPARLTATAGETIEFKLENKADAEYYLELLAPDNTELGEAAAHAGEDAEFVSELTEPGDYGLKVFRDGHEDDLTTLTLTVSP